MTLPILQQMMIPQKRKFEFEESSYTNDETVSNEDPATATPPKLRRILAKYPDQNSITGIPSDITDPFYSKSITNSYLTLDSIDAISKNYRKTSFRILRVNVLQRDEIARMDGKAHVLDDIYDINGEVNMLAWPLTARGLEEPPRVPVVRHPIIPTRVLRSQRQSASPSVSKPSTPASTPAPTPAPAALEAPQAPPASISPTSHKTEKLKLKIPALTSLPATVKAEPKPLSVPTYKKLPCRGDTVEMRIAKLRADPWSDASKLTAKSVFCLGCQKRVSLDKRFDYYPGFWETHKRRCPGIQGGQPKKANTVNVL